MTLCGIIGGVDGDSASSFDDGWCMNVGIAQSSPKRGASCVHAAEIKIDSIVDPMVIDRAWFVSRLYESIIKIVKNTGSL